MCLLTHLQLLYQKFGASEIFHSFKEEMNTFIKRGYINLIKSDNKDVTQGCYFKLMYLSIHQRMLKIKYIKVSTKI